MSHWIRKLNYKPLAGTRFWFFRYWKLQKRSVTLVLHFVHDLCRVKCNSSLQKTSVPFISHKVVKSKFLLLCISFGREGAQKWNQLYTYNLGQNKMNPPPPPPNQWCTQTKTRLSFSSLKWVGVGSNLSFVWTAWLNLGHNKMRNTPPPQKKKKNK